MKRNPLIFLRCALLLGDFGAIVLSFAFAYFFRTHIDPRPFMFESELANFTISIICLTPILLIVNTFLGLYKTSIINPKKYLTELPRVFIAAILDVSALITYDFFKGDNLFPVRIMAVYAVIITFVFLILERVFISMIFRLIFKKNHGTRRVIIVGNSKNTTRLADFITSFPEQGYRLKGIIAATKYIPDDLIKYQRDDLEAAIKQSFADMIFQTDEKDTESVYKTAVENHALYYFVPSESSLSSQLGELELIGSVPAILVKTTPLSGAMTFIKRLFDILFALFAIIIAIIPMAIVWLVLKISNPHASPIYSDQRLTRFNNQFKCLKFRSMKPEFSGMTAEAAFKKMGRLDLIKQYRADGDYIKNDPRITKFGAFLRKTSIDELPQLFNILKGDISLIGPRALLPNELETYGDRSLILSVKSGLTGLAQVSGRRDIDFAERRALDIYYVKNWSLALDFQIFLKTITTVFGGKGAK